MESIGLYILETILSSLLRYLVFLFSIGVVLYLSIRFKGTTASIAILGLCLQVISFVLGLFFQYGSILGAKGNHELFISYLQANSIVGYLGYTLVLFSIFRWLQQHLPIDKASNSVA